MVVTVSGKNEQDLQACLTRSNIAELRVLLKEKMHLEKERVAAEEEVAKEKQARVEAVERQREEQRAEWSRQQKKKEEEALRKEYLYYCLNISL